MKKILIIIFIETVFFDFSLSAKSTLLGLDRVKEKVNSAISDSSKVIFSEYLMHKSQIKGGDVEAIKKIEASIQSLYWCKQICFVAKLELLINQRDKALLALKDEISKKYPSAKSQLLSFASDVVNEKKDVENLTTEAMRLMQDAKNDVQTKTKIKQIFNQLGDYNNILSRLINAFDGLLSL
jgi:hypothetical protein